MNRVTESLLLHLGDDLDRLVYPEVHDGGIVWPARPSVIFQMHGLENSSENSKSVSGQRKPRETRAAGTPGASGTPGHAGAPLAASSLARDLHGLAAAVEALTWSYPETKSAETSEAVWLRVPAFVLPRFGYRALFVVAIVPSRKITRGWGFWEGGGVGMVPIGPRHTNYGDGSICAFDESDGTWTYGDSLVTLLDLYTGWAVRHLHLERFGRWPGPQAFSRPLERLLECQDSEWCGCENPKGRYGECCQSSDQEFAARSRGAWCAQALLSRSVPASIRAYALAGPPPSVILAGSMAVFP